MGNNGNFQWEAVVRRLISLVTALCMFAPLALYLLFSYGSQKAGMKAAAEVSAYIITTEINRNPDYWKYQDLRFASVLRRGSESHDHAELRQLFDGNRELVASAGVPQSPPLLEVDVPVFDAGNIVGYLRFSRSQGKTLYVAALVLAVSCCCGALIYYILHSFPLRVLRSAFAALHKAKEQATITLDSIADAVITTDSTLNIRSLNPAAVNIVGRESRSMIGERMLDHFRIVHPRTGENLENAFQERLQIIPALGRFREQVVLVRLRDGREFEIEMTVSQLRDEQAKLLGLVVAFHDVTESRALETQLQERVTELMHIVRHAGVGIAFVRGGTVQRINDNAAEIIGLPKEKVLGADIIEVLGNSLGYTDSIELIYERLGQGELFDIEHQMVRQDGKHIWLRLIGKGIDPNRLRETGTVWIAQDISLMKQRQQELEAATSHAEEASRFKSEFLAHVSHELRSPLSGIIGLNRLVLDSSLTPEQRNYLTSVSALAETLLQLLNDLLDLSKIEAGAMKLERKAFELNAVYSYVSSILALKVKEKGLGLDLSIAEDVPPALVGDELRLSQILLNLLGNAVKFTDQGAVGVECRKTADKGTSIQLQFKVVDSGCGLDSEARQKIFDSFVQASSSVARTHGGSGLGLAICKKLTELMGGEIWVESTLGKGSAFYFTAWFNTIGLVEESQELAGGERRVPGCPEVKGAKRILLVEDLPFNQTIAKLLLERDGHHVQVAGNGREALIALAEASFDVVFMDVRMPVMDGLTTTRLIRRCETDSKPQAREDNELIRAVAARIQGGRIHIVGMTGDATDDGRQECFAAGMNGFVSKPFDRKELLQALTPS